jgi:5-methylcytosine-specific restriction endonuclease McrA
VPYKNPEEQRKFQRLWVAKRRADHFKGKKCKMCGKPVSSKTADLDHIKPHGNTEKIDHRLWSLKDSKRKKKLSGMQTLCRACHKKKTAKDIKNMAEEITNMAAGPMLDLKHVQIFESGLSDLDILITNILNKIGK